MISGNRDQAIWSSFTSIFILQVLSFDLTRARPREKKAFILCAKDLQSLRCSYFQVVFKKKPVLLLNYSNRYLRRTRKPAEGSELRPQPAEAGVALLTAPTPLQTSALPRPAFTPPPELLQPQGNTARKAGEALLPRERAHCLLRTTALLPADTSGACHFLPVPFHCHLPGLCLTVLSLLPLHSSKAIEYPTGIVNQ